MKNPISMKEQAKRQSEFLNGADKPPSMGGKKSKQRTYSQTDEDIQQLNKLMEKILGYKDSKGFSLKLSKSATLRVAVNASLLFADKDPALFKSLLSDDLWLFLERKKPLHASVGLGKTVANQFLNSPFTLKDD